MRKVYGILGLLMVFALLLALPVMALAEEAGTVPSTFFTWESIATFSGAVAAVVFIVQLFKLPLDKVWHIPTQYIVYVVSVGVLLLAQAFVPALGGLTWETGILCAVNGGLVALAAMSTYEVTIRKIEALKIPADAIFAETVDLSFDDTDVQKIAAAVAAEVKQHTASIGT